MAQPDIFLSYNREDTERAKQFAEALSAGGFDVWWDVVLRSGEAFDEVTEKALRNAKTVIVLWSPRSVVSRWVRAEATLAERLKTLMSVTIEPCERPIMFELTQTTDLSHWHGDTADPAWQAFLADLHKSLGTQVKGSPFGQAPKPDVQTAVSGARTVRRPWMRFGLPLLAVLTVLAVGSWVLFDGKAAAAPRVMVEPLQVGANDSDAKLLRQTLTTDLNRVVLGNDTTLNFTDIEDPGEARRKADYIVAGDAQTNADELHASARLVEASDGTILWTQNFEDNASDLKLLRHRMAYKIADVLICAFGSRAKRPRDIQLPTLKLFLSGCENYDTDYSAARKYFAEVVERRPDFAQAHAMYASVLFNIVDQANYWDSSSGAQRGERAALMAQAKAEAKKALDEDGKLGIAYYVLAGTDMTPWPSGFQRRRSIIRQGLAVDPDATELYRIRGAMFGNIDMMNGEPRDGEHAAELDPFSVINLANLAESYGFGGRLQEGLALLRKAREAYPDDPNIGEMRFELVARKGDPKRVLTVLDNPKANPDYSFVFPELWRPFLEARINPAKVDPSAFEIMNEAARSSNLGRAIAIQDLVQLGKLDDAYKLALALPPVSRFNGYLWFWDFMAPFRADPRFAQFAARQELTQVWATFDHLPDFCHQPDLRWKCPATPAGWKTYAK